MHGKRRNLSCLNSAFLWLVWTDRSNNHFTGPFVVLRGCVVPCTMWCCQVHSQSLMNWSLVFICPILRVESPLECATVRMDLTKANIWTYCFPKLQKSVHLSRMRIRWYSRSFMACAYKRIFPDVMVLLAPSSQYKWLSVWLQNGLPYVKTTTYVLVKCQKDSSFNRPHHKLTDSHGIMVYVLTKY